MDNEWTATRGGKSITPGLEVFSWREFKSSMAFSRLSSLETLQKDDKVRTGETRDSRQEEGNGWYRNEHVCFRTSPDVMP